MKLLRFFSLPLIFPVVSVCALLALGAGGLRAATFTVTQGGDAGAGSLRQAILDVNAAAPGQHVIVFSGVTEVAFTTLPPPVFNGVLIDGSPPIARKAGRRVRSPRMPASASFPRRRIPTGCQSPTSPGDCARRFLPATISFGWMTCR
jgi:hypothetical protein